MPRNLKTARIVLILLPNPPWCVTVTSQLLTERSWTGLGYIAAKNKSELAGVRDLLIRLYMRCQHIHTCKDRPILWRRVAIFFP